MRWIFIIATVLAIGACQTPAVIADINDSSLKVQAGIGTTDQQILAKAAEGCGLYNKQPTRISHSCMDEYCFGKLVLFACR